MKICANCNNEFPSSMKIEGKKRNLSTRKYCLVCSPFNQHNTKQIDYKAFSDTKYCKGCDDTLNKDQFYVTRNGRKLSTYCKKCSNEQTIKRQRDLKIKSVEYLGNKCYDCKNKYPYRVYDFHHVNPSIKDFTIAHSRFYSFDKIKKELDKCVLLCANCHRLRHND